MLEQGALFEEKSLLGVSELALAHVGDAVYELLTRTYLLQCGLTTAAHLHRETVARVAAPAQAAAVEKLLPHLTEEELAVYRRGRNVHPHGVPKRATPGQYARATGLEALFGWLYLQGRNARILELFEAITEEDHAV